MESDEDAPEFQNFAKEGGQALNLGDENDFLDDDDEDDDDEEEEDDEPTQHPSNLGQKQPASKGSSPQKSGG